MASSPKLTPQETEVAFARDLSLFDATMIGIGAMIGAGVVVIAMGLTFVAFEGYDLIATVAEEIKAPEKTILRATMISLVVTGALVIVMAWVIVVLFTYFMYFENSRR